MNFFRSIVLVCICAVVPYTCQAGFILDFGQNGTLSNEFTVMPGSQVEIQYFLTQTDSETRLNTEGLGGFLIEISVPMGSGLTLNNGFNFVDGLDSLPLFELSANSTNLSAAAFADTTDDELSVDPVVLPSGVNSILLGSSLINVSSTFSGSAILSASDAPSGSFSFGANPLNIVDISIGTASVVAVPESSSLAMFGLAMLGGFALMLRRRRGMGR